MDKEYKLNLDSNEMCRGCLARNCTLTTLFCDEIVDGEILPMPKVFESVTKLTVHENDGYPQKICANCSAKAIETYIFRQKCEKSRRLFQKLFNLTENTLSTKTASESIETQTQTPASTDASVQVDTYKLDPIEYAFDDNELEYARDNDTPMLDDVEPIVDVGETNVEYYILLDGEKDDDASLRVKQVPMSESNETIFMEFDGEMNKSDTKTHTKLKPKKEPHKDKVIEEIAKPSELDDSMALDIDSENETLLKCHQCNKKFSDSKLFARHMKEHMLGFTDLLPFVLTSINFFRCARCRAVFPTADDLQKHFDDDEVCIQLTKANLDDTCIDYQYLDDPITESIDFIRVISCYSHEDRYVCEICDTLHATMDALSQHFDTDHLDNRTDTEDLYIETINQSHWCGACKQSCLNLKDTIFHVYCFHQNKFHCPFADCSQCFNKLLFLNRHISRTHSTDIQHPCAHCDYVALNYHDYKNHLNIDCKGRKYQCSYCDKRFFRHNTYSVHLKIHTKTKKYQCHVCEKSFIQSNDLKNHIRIHTKERPYECSICGKSFKTFGNRSDHLATHAEANNFQCDICLKTFKSARILRGHKKLHEERGFECDVCSKKFSRKYHLKGHMRIHEKHKSDS